MAEPGTLYLLSGKMAAGKSTLATRLATEHGAILLVQDELLGALFGGHIVNVPSYLACWTKLTRAIGPVVCDVLTRGVSVVLDFPGNTRTQHAWFRELIDRSGARHELHFLDVPDSLCKRQLRQRSQGLPAGTKWTTDADFDAITAYFEGPGPDEGFTIVRHTRE